MDLNILQLAGNDLEDAVFDRNQARKEFRQFCNSKASLPDSMGQAIEDRLVIANDRVKSARKRFRFVMQSR